MKMKFVREIIYAVAPSWNSGKGHKFTRRGEYEKALRHYQLALEYDAKSGSEPNPTKVECLARTQARLGGTESFEPSKRLNPLM